MNAALFVLLSAAPAAAPPLPYFPLEPGIRWTYVLEERPASQKVVTVLGLKGGLVRVDLGGVEVLLQDRGDEIDIDLPEEGLVPHYRFEEDSWLHRNVFSCDDRREITVGAKGEVVETPLDIFPDCLRLEYGLGACADGGTVVEWWAREVGRVKWIEQSIIGPRTWVLISMERDQAPLLFLRGDGDGSGEIDLSDPVHTLNWLVLGGPEPGCHDAADSNDDGRTDISDAIFTLGYLFLGTAPPPPPGPTSCGKDPGGDSLPDCVSSSCRAGISA